MAKIPRSPTKTWWAKLALAAGLLLVGYGFASWAIDTGSLWQYTLAIIFIVAGLNRAVVGSRLAFKP